MTLRRARACAAVIASLAAVNPGWAGSAATPSVPIAPTSGPHAILDPALAQPQSGDSPATGAARHRLGVLIDRVQRDEQNFDAAVERHAQARAALARARTTYRAAVASAHDARSRYAAAVAQQYTDGDSALPGLGALLTSSDPNAVLDRLSLLNMIDERQAATLAAAGQAERRSADARAAEATAAESSRGARDDAVRALEVARNAEAVASQLVLRAHLADVRAQAAAAAAAATAAASANNPDSVSGAAAALRTQALATGAAGADDFAAATNDAAVISVATRALLAQAAGLSAAPTGPAGAAAFVPTTGEPMDESAVMGAAPELGGRAPYRGHVGVGPVRALEPFVDDPVQDGWPSGGVGTSVPGTAKTLPSNGATVNPTLTAPTGPMLRAAVAVDAALAQLGRPYVWDAAGPTSFDCSGLTLWAWEHAGVVLPHFAAAQALRGVPVAPGQMLPGDLVLFGSDLHHVGIYLGAGYMIDAPQTGDYVKVQRVSDDGDFAVAIRP
jgi:peptidoglycan DL-endopeptidase CwlO